MDVRLRPMSEADVDRIETAGSDPEGLGPLQWFGYRDFAKMRRRVAEDGFLGPDGGGLTVDAGGEMAGYVTWIRQTWGPEATSWCWSIGISLFPGFRGRGIGTAAQRELVDYLFAHTRAERVQAITDVANLPEQRALEKAGFVREGVLRRAQWRTGAWHDQILYAVLRELHDSDGELA